MSIPALLIDGLWSALLAAAIAIIFAAPLQALMPSFFGGFIARVARDGLMQAGASQTVATLAAAAAVVIVVMTMVRIRRPGISPIVILSSFVPLGAAKPFFLAIIGILKVTSLKGEALAAAPVALLTNISLVFKTTIAIAIGATLGAIIVQAVSFARDRNVGADAQQT